MRLDEVSVATGLLHDVVEDTLVEPESIRDYFGDEIAHLVDGLTKIAQISNQSREEQQAENVRKMLLAMVDDVRVVLVKLADRLHNMRTLQYLKPEKRRRIAQETLDIFAPIAHRLGMGTPAQRAGRPRLQAPPSGRVPRARRAAGSAAAPSTRRSSKRSPRASRRRCARPDVPYIRVEGRVKRLYSIWKKLKRQKIELDQVYDLIAARVITPDESRHCYAALGVIHTHLAARPRALQGLDRHAARQPLPVAPHLGHRHQGAALRGSDSHRGDAPHRRGGRRRPLEVQGGTPRRARRRRGVPVAALARRVVAGGQGLARLPRIAQARPLPEGRLRLHADGQGHPAPARRDARGFRLHDPHRGREHVHRRAHQRAHGSAARRRSRTATWSRF